MREAEHGCCVFRGRFEQTNQKWSSNTFLPQFETESRCGAERAHVSGPRLEQHVQDRGGERHLPIQLEELGVQQLDLRIPGVDLQRQEDLPLRAFHDGKIRRIGTRRPGRQHATADRSRQPGLRIRAEDLLGAVQGLFELAVPKRAQGDARLAIQTLANGRLELRAAGQLSLRVLGRCRPGTRTGATEDYRREHTHQQPHGVHSESWPGFLQSIHD